MLIFHEKLRTILRRIRSSRGEKTRHVINSREISQSRAPEGWPVSVQLGSASPIVAATKPEIADALAAGSLFPSFNHPPLPKCDLGLHQLTFLSFCLCVSLSLYLPSSPAPVNSSSLPSLILASRSLSHLDSPSTLTTPFSRIPLFNILIPPYDTDYFHTQHPRDNYLLPRVATRFSSASVLFVYPRSDFTACDLSLDNSTLLPVDPRFR